MSPLTLPEPTRECPSPAVRHVVVVSSPKAGSGLGREQIPRLMRLLSEHAIAAQITDSITELRSLIALSKGTPEHAGLEAPGPVREIGQRQLDDPDPSWVVVAAGGDGTLALVAENVPSSVPIVPMPLGTENLLARHFGFSPVADQVVATIEKNESIWIDAGRANGRLFLVLASAGFDAEVVQGMHLTRRGHIHRYDYIRPILRAARRYGFPEIRVEIDGDEVRCPLLRWAMMFNLPRYALGLPIEPDAVGNDGEVDLIGFTQGSIVSGFRYAGGVVLGQHRKWRDVVRHRGSRMVLTSKARVPYQLDGDYVGRLPLVVETLAKRVRLLAPALAIPPRSR